MIKMIIRWLKELKMFVRWFYDDCGIINLRWSYELSRILPLLSLFHFLATLYYVVVGFSTCFVKLTHRYLGKVDGSIFVVCLLLALAHLRVLLWRPLTVLIRHTIQAVHTIHQSILKMMSMGKLNALLKSPKVYNKIMKLNSIFLMFWLIMDIKIML